MSKDKELFNKFRPRSRH